MKAIIGILLLSLQFCFYNPVSAQEINAGPKPIDVMSIGLGLGLDCGGIGMNATLFPQRNIGLFAGVGYALAGLGWNAGLKLRAISDNSKSRVSPFLLAMYGYNAAIAVVNQKSLNKIFYGPSFGIGLDTRIKHGKWHYWSFAILVPVRSSEVNNYIDDLKNNHGIEFNSNLLPIAISISYKLVTKKL